VSIIQINLCARNTHLRPFNTPQTGDFISSSFDYGRTIYDLHVRFLFQQHPFENLSIVYNAYLSLVGQEANPFR